MIDSIYKAAGLTVTEIAEMPALIAGTGGSSGGYFYDSTSFDKLYEYFAFESCEMPYGTAKARDGDPECWILEYLERLV